MKTLSIWIKLLSVAALVCLVLGLALPQFTGSGRGGPDAAPASQLDTYWAAPAFTLTDQRGQTLTDRDLAGQVWLADFFFTSCPGICPMLSANMQDLYAQLSDEPWGESVRIVTFSLDPQRDTVEVLAEYADAIGADPRRWSFLRGPREEIWKISQQGFKLSVDDTPGNPAGPIGHSGRVALVDRDGQIRGFYDGLTAEGIAALRADLERIVPQ